MRFAINIGDLTRVPPFIAQALLGPVTPLREIIDAERGQLDGAAVILECDAERAQALVDVLRWKIPRHLLRAYREGSRGGWTRV